MTKATEARARSRECRLQVHAALEHGPLTWSELQAALPDVQPSHLRGALMRLIKTGTVHSTGTTRERQEPAYELWAHITARLRDRARERSVSTVDDIRTESPGWENARRVA